MRVASTNIYIENTEEAFAARKSLEKYLENGSLGKA